MTCFACAPSCQPSVCSLPQSGDTSSTLWQDPSPTLQQTVPAMLPQAGEPLPLMSSDSSCVSLPSPPPRLHFQPSPNSHLTRCPLPLLPPLLPAHRFANTPAARQLKLSKRWLEAAFEPVMKNKAGDGSGEAMPTAAASHRRSSERTVGPRSGEGGAGDDDGGSTDGAASGGSWAQEEWVICRRGWATAMFGPDEAQHLDPCLQVDRHAESAAACCPEVAAAPVPPLTLAPVCCCLFSMFHRAHSC